QVFADYYANDALAVICQAWLGPRYQVTSQVNVVNPGGTRQVPHRDYHLGFVSAEQLAEYPAHVHRTSPVLTLQGAVAHCDMPVDSGPTMLLPFSQLFEGGYIAFNRPEFVEFFAEHHVQVPLAKGDALFFNPALYHGAGSNVSTGTSQIRRIANLLQISSPFGRAMEALDRTAMVRAVYPALRAMKAAGHPQRELLNAVVATAEGYAFPTNLDSDQPIGALAPPSQVDTVLAALSDDMTPEQLDVALRDQNDRRKP
ncbi:MAG: protein involved in biosynthesis of mitomycin antibiotics/polyketide fumonisin, partial [Mycobacterium sp.]|nr:protein involved in biosynthesis of mitomycin antibiotics/polyketide fumonisin [Mycobacterium sp.]